MLASNYCVHPSMMFIENTLLEENPQYIEQNRADSSPASAASVVLSIADVEEVNTPLHLNLHIGVTPYEELDANNQLVNGEPLLNGEKPEEPTKLQGVYELPIKEAQSKGDPTFTIIKSTRDPTSNITVAEGEEADDCEVYELLDVSTENDCTEWRDCTEQDLAGVEEIYLQFAYDEAKGLPDQISSKQANGTSTPPKVQQITTDSQKLRRCPRPVPDLLPINTGDIINRNACIYAPSIANSGKVILNGNPYAARNDFQVESCYNYLGDSTDFSRVSYTSLDSYVLREDAVSEIDFEYIRSEESQGATTVAQPNGDPMGVDIFTKLKRLLSYSSSSKKNDQENNSKRKYSEGGLVDSLNERQFKYRRVENSFPSFISTPMGEDLQMTQNRYSIEKPKARKSMFVPPQITHKFIKNTTYADIEFSDDDEPVIINSFVAGAAAGGVQNRHSAYSIPINNVHPEKRAALPTKASTSALFEARAPSMGLYANLMPELNAMPRQSYANVLRQRRSGAIGYGLGEHSGRSTSTSGASTSRAGASCLNSNKNVWSFNSRSILSRERDTEEREQYQQLLQKMIPALYGPSETSPLATQNGDVSRRRAILLNGTTNAAAGAFPTARQKLPTARSGQQPLSSTINLEDDDDDDGDVIALPSVGVETKKPKKPVPTVILDDDDDISSIVDLGTVERPTLPESHRLGEQMKTVNIKKKEPKTLPHVEPVNSLQNYLNVSPHLASNWLQNFESKWKDRKSTFKKEISETEKIAQRFSSARREREWEIQRSMRELSVFEPDLVIIDEFPEPEQEVESFVLTQEQEARGRAAVCGPPDVVLVSKFNLKITRRDLLTLVGLNWLNDEIINFYMNLITERSENREDLPKVYAMNTFFIPRLLQSGHSGVKRWTRKVDIFSKDIIPMPVHVGGVHWCMAIVHMRNRTVRYYDSMGTPNPHVLAAIENYLQEESMDKRKQPFDTSDFHIESVRDVPRQMNGSDCGVFSCMFAEYITRNRNITFGQQHMEYFRRRMILEIVQGELLQ